MLFPESEDGDKQELSYSTDGHERRTYVKRETMKRHLADFRPLLNEVLQLTVKSYSFKYTPPFWQILQENPRLVIAISHSTPASWIPVVCALSEEACKSGGGSRKPLGVMHRFFFQYPFLRQIGHFMSQSSHALGFTDLIRHFQRMEKADLVIFPEGSNAVFGEPNIIKEFRSPRFAEIAIRGGAPILLVVHRGSEPWAKTLPLPELFLNFLGKIPGPIAARMLQARALAVPILPTRKIPHLQVACELYHPSLKAEDLEHDRARRREQISREAENIRNKMIEMLNELQSGS